VSAAAPEQSIILDLWTVPDGSQEEFMEALVGLFELVRKLDGFLEGQILTGVDSSLFVCYTRMRSAQDRDAALIDPEVEAVRRAIGGIAHPKPHAYTLARTFTPA